MAIVANRNLVAHTTRQGFVRQGMMMAKREIQRAGRWLMLAVVLASAAGHFAATALAQAPVVSHLVPSAAVPGKPTDITVYGANLAGPTALWTNLAGPSGPATIELAPGIEGNGTKADQVVLRVTLPDAPAQVAGLRIATGLGVSSMRLLMADDLASISENGQNKSLETAQEVTLPVAIDGAAEAESFDFFKFTGHAGQRLSAEVFARRLGSPLDAVIRLLDANGRELAYSDDEGGIGADSRLAIEFPADGVYYVEIRDIRYQGAGNFRYRLRLGDFPLVTAPFPTGAARGSVAHLQMAGPSVARLSAVDVPVAAMATTVPVSTRFADGQGSATSVLAVSAGGEQVEFEPNNAVEQASPVTVPGAISGRFTEPGDRDIYQFDVAAGQRLLFVGRTRSLSSPTDLFMRLQKADGSQVAEVDDLGTEEGVLNFTFPEAGAYRLVVEDLHHRGGPQHVYRIEVIPYQPGFLLGLEADKFDVPKAGVFVTKVNAVRFDYNGPITLSIEGAGEGFALANNTIPEGKNETVMAVTAPASLEPGQFRDIRIVGRAKIDEVDYSAVASTSAALKGALAGLPYPPEALNGVVGLGVGPVFADFFKLSVPGEPVWLPQLVGLGKFTIHADRLNGFAEAIALNVDGLPPGVSAEVKPLEKDKADIEVILRGPAALAEGEYRFRVVGAAAFQEQPKQVVLGDVRLAVGPPLRVTFEPAGPITTGATQKCKIKLQRAGEESPAVAVSLRNLPLGITAPAELVVPAGQAELEFELTAAADAAVGSMADLRAVASATIAGRQLRVEGPATILEVKMP